MNEIDEFRKKYHMAVEDARQAYFGDVYKFLEDHNLDKKVVRKKDRKIGWLKLDYGMRLNFHPITKNGTRSLNSSGWFSDNEVLETFEPYKEDGE